MSEIGYVNVHSYESNAQIPLRDVAIAITDETGDAISLRLTNKSGMFDRPVEVQVPDLSKSQTPGSKERPFSVINIYARKNNFEEIVVKNVQVFPGTITMQELEMIPLPEYSETPNISESFDIPAPNL